jgi:hypothetical protein
MIFHGDVVLPGGRIVHGRIVAAYERDTNATNVLSVDLSWPDGEELTDDEYNEDLGYAYLHEFATDALLLMRPEETTP